MKLRLKSLACKLLKLAHWVILVGILAFQITFLLQNNELHDFGSFIASGEAANKGDNPYGIYPLTSEAEEDGQVVYFTNLNPPVSLYIFKSLAKIDPVLGKNILTVISITLYICALIPLFIALKVPWIWFMWALSLAGFWDTLVLGQIYVFIFITIVIAWWLLREGHEIPAGILIGLAAAIKPNLLLWPLLLFLAGNRRSAISALLVWTLASILPVFQYGYLVYVEWYHAVSNATWTSLPHYISLFGLVNRINIPWLAYPLALVLVGLISWWAWKMRGDIQLVSGVAIVMAILVSPLATPRFTILLIPFYYFLVGYPRLWISAAVLVVPTEILIWSGFQSEALGFTLSLLYPLGLFLLLVVALVKSSDTNLLTFTRIRG